jgi:hypothetical protein
MKGMLTMHYLLHSVVLNSIDPCLAVPLPDTSGAVTNLRVSCTHT